jgi:hypothetical protein
VKLPQPTPFFIASITLTDVGIFEMFVTDKVFGFGIPLVAGAISLAIGTEIIRRNRKKQ